MRSRYLAHSSRAVHALVGWTLVACGGSDEPVSPEPFPVIGNPTAVALASPSAVPENGTLALDGSASNDSAGEPLSHLWEQTMGPTVAIADPSAAATTATVPEVNENRAVTLRLTVTNRSGVVSTDLVFITVIDGGIAPTASAGADQRVDARSEVTLDGTTSSDPDGTLVNYLWERVSGPDVQLLNPASESATFTAPDVSTPGVLLFRLTVTDSDGISANDTVVVEVDPVPTQLAFIDASATSLRNTPLAPLAVEVQNHSGERITAGPAASTAIALSVTSGAASLSGSMALTATDGVAVLEDTSYPAVESTIELTASATGLTDAMQTLDVIWPSVFPALIPSTLIPVDAVSLENQEDPPSLYPDALIAYTADGTVDLDLSAGDESLTTQGEDLVLARYRADGSLLWSRHFDAAEDQSAVAMELTRDGDVIVLFALNGTVDVAREPPALELASEGVSNVGVLRVDAATGDIEWATRFGGEAQAVATDLVLAGNDDPFVVGWFDGAFDPDPSDTTDERISDGIDGFALRLLGSALEAGSGAPLSFARTPSFPGDDRFYAAALSDSDDLNAGGSRDGDSRAWVYRVDRLGENELTSFTFAGTGALNAIYDLEARGTSVQVVGVVSGDSDFGGETVLEGGGGGDGFFAVYSAEDDTLAFVRRVAGSGDDTVYRLARTAAFDASFVLVGTVEDSADLDFGLSQENFAVNGGGVGTFLLSLGFDGRIKWTSELAPTVGVNVSTLAPQTDDTLWMFGALDGPGTVDLDPFAPVLDNATQAGDHWALHFDPARSLVVP